ncbi:FAD-dependent oxidoreductase [Leifsonia sp. NPDC058292]|uniref:FAD-dependent oxidoreductase n=1 Tax=Leifsonia sp. NPDC058292 TaxID=3346428 RepID=UPI0036DD58CF
MTDDAHDPTQHETHSPTQHEAQAPTHHETHDPTQHETHSPTHNESNHPTHHETQPPQRVEVLVYGATSAGVAAAVAAAEAGAQTLLVEPGRHVGGMTSGGLGYTDVGDVRALGGAAERFRRDVAAHYGVEPGRFAGPEPHVAEQIFTSWLEAAGVDVVFEERATSVQFAASQAGPVIRAVGFDSGRIVEAGVVVDASYEGDLLPLAGVPYAVGREDRTLYGERFAGRREVVPGMHNMPPWVSPFVGDPSGRIPGPVLPQVRDVPLAEVGSGDGGVMSYGYRVCLTTAADRIPFERPLDYDESYWELGRRLFARDRAAGQERSAGRMLGLEPNLPGGMADGNSLGPFSLSVLDGSAWEYPDASPERREQLRQRHLSHTRGFLYFLSTDASVPAGIRKELARWGLPAGEFADTGHLPHQLYVREARRMLGDRVLTEHDLLAGTIFDDTVALGSYHIDIREVQRTWRTVHEHPTPVGLVVTEGYLSVPVPVYGIPYRSLTPQREHCVNLLVPVCLSASHVAFASVRMEPQYEMLGHAAGIAAALAVAEGCAVQDVPHDRLRQRLVDAGQKLEVR